MSSASSDKQAITDLLQSYSAALSKSSTEDVIKLYHPSAWLLAQGFPIITGKDSIKTWYDQCFENLALNVTFEVKEVHVISEDHAFATTTSEGTQKILKSGASSSEGNHELFVLMKDANEWKIGRYCFSTFK